MDEDYLHNPHDHFIKASLGRPQQMATLLRTFLPSSLTSGVDWTSLKRESGDFIDQQLREQHCDLLFTARWQGKPAYFCLLFEHQRKPDKKMPFRLLRYMVRIWEDWQGKHPEHPLPLILPIVFYQNQRPWPYSCAFADSLDWPLEMAPEEKTLWLSMLPDLRHRVLNLSEIDTNQVAGELWLRVSLKFLSVVLLEKREEVLKEAFAAINEIESSHDSDELLNNCVKYLLGGGPGIDKEELILHLDIVENSRTKEAVMTMAESLIKEGRQEGRQEGRLEEAKLMLKRQLIRRFGEIIPAHQESLERASLEKIEFWAEEFFDAISVDDLLSR